MRTNDLKQVIIDEDDMVEVLYRGETIDTIVVEEPTWVGKFNDNCELFGLPFNLGYTVESDMNEDEYIARNLEQWNLPSCYRDLDVHSLLISKCDTEEEIDRVESELVEFEARGMIPVLRWLAYFVDTMKENNHIWGVGRGSSVSSYVLYLIGVHRVNSLKYDLSIKEFLK